MPDRSELMNDRNRTITAAQQVSRISNDQDHIDLHWCVRTRAQVRRLTAKPRDESAALGAQGD